MNRMRTVRKRLNLTQNALAAELGCTQGNVGHYEAGQTVPPDVAKRLILLGRSRGVAISYEDVYGVPGEPDGHGEGGEPVEAGEGAHA